MGSDKADPIAAADLGDGTYAASYIPTQVGTDEIAVTLDGAPLGGSPFSSVVSAGAVSPEHSTADVPAGRRRRVTSIVVQARDAYGHPVSVGGQTVVITIDGRNPTGPSLAVDMGDGTYTWSYTPARTGSDYLTITMDGTPIEGSPYRSRVRR